MNSFLYDSVLNKFCVVEKLKSCATAFSITWIEIWDWSNNVYGIFVVQS
jgi:hypothetical protein